MAGPKERKPSKMDRYQLLLSADEFMNLIRVINSSRHEDSRELMDQIQASKSFRKLLYDHGHAHYQAKYADEFTKATKLDAA